MVLNWSNWHQEWVIRATVTPKRLGIQSYRTDPPVEHLRERNTDPAKAHEILHSVLFTDSGVGQIPETGRFCDVTVVWRNQSFTTFQILPTPGLSVHDTN